MKYKSKIVSRGIAFAEIFVYEQFNPVITESFIESGSEKKAVEFYETTRQKAKSELLSIYNTLINIDEEKAMIFQAHIDILYDEAMDEEVKELIENDLYAQDFAIQTIFDKYEKLLRKAKDKLISERADDIVDVKKRLLRCFAGIEEKNISKLDKPVIIAAHDLLPSDTATLDRKNVLGILTEVGGTTSHSAIIARSYEIPALIGIEELHKIVKNGDKVILDAIDGDLIINPSKNQISEFENKRFEWINKKEKIEKYKTKKPLTKDGEYISIGLNIGSASQLELENAEYIDFVGLFRTEFLYMENDHIPTEDEQFLEYKKVLLACGNRPVTIRTLDIGGDKTLPYMELPKEDNPFLGNRALRLCFSNIDMFNTQLRAILRASKYGNVWLMFPMVGSLEDFRRAKEAVENAKKELIREGIEFDDSIKLGIMIEIPSIALIADLIAEEIDFASIGTNDLCQYLCAVDRQNALISDYYQSFHPSMFRTMKFIIRQFIKADKPICVCGELGGNPLVVPLLIGFGMRKFSMSISAVAQIKHVISTLTIKEMEKLAEDISGLKTALEVEEYLSSKINKA